ncbi:MAG: bifunctional diaminohydroxyphosphoribosylaminopyrimidine deaminase/5-amino-6-(5-phosphoribosylamino)uracil reductase RibD [Dysgonamonadaceae bacterium]|jgi:diaminohydroxyphosphoribosylaminopyrimidine deaminase/5-amino-6-(5-phosphoribosylamino)uracil reductase|nr:bifunctional diaminohydroxyphosphoribosylaminopyrimidine deaminase/5-amino-6-(5-phosphoribosylamino)uracil reductase RibD [Dysgonamonadaceae bacterium]
MACFSSLVTAYSSFTEEEKYMHRCLQLAGYGNGWVAPNPMVGTVIVHQGKIIGEGFHRKYGEAHAEVNAINAVRNLELLKESTLYVNLEPCSHYGKTPPCTRLIIEKQIPRVIIGQIDPFPTVSGKGIKMLNDAGIEVSVGILEKECERLNRRFITYHQKHRPYIILKWAQSSDGFMDRLRETGDGQSPIRFSNDFTQILVHKMRAEEAAIMVGSRTEKLDKPQLNVRFWDGNNPKIIKPFADKSLSAQMSVLYEQKIQSLMVEGGSKLLQSFINEHLWDEAQVEINPMKLKKGVKIPNFSGTLENVQKCKKSTVLVFWNSLKL